jgi:hypothetical protein
VFEDFDVPSVPFEYKKVYYYPVEKVYAFFNVKFGRKTIDKIFFDGKRWYTNTNIFLEGIYVTVSGDSVDLFELSLSKFQGEVVGIVLPMDTPLELDKIEHNMVMEYLSRL